MMGKTHIFVGTAAAFAVTMPDTPSGCLAALIGGAVGGMISDIDLDSVKHYKDTLHTKLIAGGIALLCFAVDIVLKCGIVSSMLADRAMLIGGAAAFAVLCILGALSAHRSFTHSILGLALFTGAVSVFCTPAAIPFAVAFASHIAIDCLNKKPVRILYPMKKGVRLKLCYADGKVGKLLMYLGMAITLMLIGVSLFKMHN